MPFSGFANALAKRKGGQRVARQTMYEREQDELERKRQEEIDARTAEIHLFERDRAAAQEMESGIFPEIPGLPSSGVRLPSGKRFDPSRSSKGMAETRERQERAAEQERRKQTAQKVMDAMLAQGGNPERAAAVAAMIESGEVDGNAMEALSPPRAQAPVEGTPEWESYYRKKNQIEAEYSRPGGSSGNAVDVRSARKGLNDAKRAQREAQSQLSATTGPQFDESEDSYPGMTGRERVANREKARRTRSADSTLYANRVESENERVAEAQQYLRELGIGGDDDEDNSASLDDHAAEMQEIIELYKEAMLTAGEDAKKKLRIEQWAAKEIHDLNAKYGIK